MHKKLISLIVFPLVLAGVVQAQPAMPTVATALEAYDMPGYFMISRNTTQSVRLVQAGNETPQGLWKIVTGLAGTGTVSFMPTALENHYMRHRSYVLYADPGATDALFAGDGSFTPRAGLADPTLVSFESQNFPGRFLIHGVTANTIGFRIDPITTDAERQRATFKLVVPRADIASRPIPADKATDLIRQPTLAWKPGAYAQKHDVYLGTDFNDVNDATRLNPLGVLISKDQDANSLALPTRLEFSTKYYWRIDEVNAPPSTNIVHGDVWSFTTEPVAYAMTSKITATASSQKSANEGPENTINGSGIASDLADVNGKAMWMTLSTKSGGTFPAWIQYDFDKLYKLHEMWVWNYNATSELDLGYGAKSTKIEYLSADDQWTTLGDFEFAQGIAEDGYAHNTTVSFNGAAAKSVRITIDETWDSVTQTGLSEVRFFYIPVWAKEPKPATNSTGIDPTTLTLGWRSGRDATAHDVYLSTDANALTKDGTAATNSYAPANLELGTKYFWRVDEVNQTTNPTTWAGEVWNFTTPDFLVVDNMEIYNATDKAIFDTWLDGYGTTTNGGQVGYGQPANNTFCETTVVHGGTKSMPFLYGRDGITTSEATRTYATAQNWAAAGVKTLTLWFSGAPENSSVSLYLKINDTKIVYSGEAGNLQRRRWNQWNVELSTLPAATVNAVSKVVIGVTGSGAGTLLIDDIRLYKAAPAVATPSDPGTTGLVAYYQMNNNVQDSSGKGNNGTVVGAPTYAAGKTGMALSFNGTTDCVDLGKKDTWNPTGSFSVSLWANIGAWGTQWGHVMVSNRGETDNSVANGWQIRRGSSTGLCWTTRGIGGTDDLTGATPPQNEWIHITCVFDQAAATKTLYINGVMSVTGTTNANDMITATTTNAYLGARATADNTSRDTFFTGMLDEIRIYHRALTAGEADFLSKP